MISDLVAGTRAESQISDTKIHCGRGIKVLSMIFFLGGCTAVPPFDLSVNGPADAPVGPKIASLVANLKCELFEAANNDRYVIPRYYNDPGLPQHYDPNVPGYKPQDPSRLFTLKNLFEEIEYVGEAEFQLDVTSTPGLAPSLAFIHPYTSATSVTSSLSLGVSQGAHRDLAIFSSVDFERLVKSPPAFGQRSKEPPLARFAPTAYSPKGGANPSEPCNQGSELAGFLGLQEELISHFIIADMNDVSVWPDPTSSKLTKLQPSDIKYGLDPITVVTDFTVTSSINGGPSWSLVHFKGPNSTAGLLNYSRAVKDTLTLTVIPVCIRQKYHTSDTKAPYKYHPEFVEGTPRWANFLPPCAQAHAQKGAALSNAHLLNLIMTNRGGALPIQ